MTRLLTLLIYLLAFSGCSKGPVANATAHFIIPPNYKGVIKLVSNDPSGRDVKTQGGQTYYPIPENGELVIQGDLPFSRHQKMSASYSDGMPCLTHHDMIPDLNGHVKYNGNIADEVALWLVATSSNECMWLYVGTRSEYIVCISDTGRFPKKVYSAR